MKSEPLKGKMAEGWNYILNETFYKRMFKNQRDSAKARWTGNWFKKHILGSDRKQKKITLQRQCSDITTIQNSFARCLFPSLIKVWNGLMHQPFGRGAHGLLKHYYGHRNHN